MSYAPITQTERIVLVDVLRGFALLGILMVNMPYMYEPMTRILIGPKPDATLVHIDYESLIKFFFEGKF